VIYLGSTNPSTSTAVFENTDNIEFVCVPVSYSSGSFCSLAGLCKNSSCETVRQLVQNQSNPCVGYRCIDDTVIYSKTRKAREWERRTDDCHKYVCDFTDGPVILDTCFPDRELSSVDGASTVSPMLQEMVVVMMFIISAMLTIV